VTRGRLRRRMHALLTRKLLNNIRFIERGEWIEQPKDKEGARKGKGKGRGKDGKTGNK
jgi:hypothetical protein